MYVPKDGVVYKDSVEALCSIDPHVIQSPPPLGGFSALEAAQSNPCWRPLVILIPLRLGLERLNRIYIPFLRAFFSFPQSLGILGGKPESSLYFVSAQDDNVFYMDPHLVHEWVDFDRAETSFESYRCPTPQKMSLADIDPSMAIGFLCKNRSEFMDFCSRVEQLNASLAGPPVFSIEDQNHSFHSSSEEEDEEEGTQDEDGTTDEDDDDSSQDPFQRFKSI